MIHVKSVADGVSKVLLKHSPGFVSLGSEPLSVVTLRLSLLNVVSFVVFWTWHGVYLFPA